ncbi:MAG TPA: hypothetical protein VNY36_03115 [Bacteroidia bacterium]|nr:hypothetical protein [Bacteroidia bacterium]
MKSKNPIYVNKQFYAGDPFKGHDPLFEIIGLKYLLARMLEQGRFEIAAIIKDRLDIIHQQLVIKNAQCIRMEMRYSLN